MVVKIKRIVWVKNNGFEIRERELDCYFKNDGSYKKVLEIGKVVVMNNSEMNFNSLEIAKH